MRRVLFLESGISGGGSFESLLQYLAAVDRRRVLPVVGFLNDTVHTQRVRDLGLEAHILDDPLLSARRRGVASRLLGRAVMWSARLSPGAGLRVLRRAQAGVIRDTAALARSCGAGLVYLNTQINRDMYGVFAAQAAGLPCVSHLRSLGGSSFDAARARLANAVVGRFVANSGACRDYWVGRGLDPSSVDVVYNAVPPLEPKPLDLGAHWPRARGVSFVVGCVGRLLAQKGQDTLLRAFAALRAEVPGALLMLVGDGPERARYESLAGELGVAEAVVFTGYETRAKEIIAALDALVLPARDEALGRVLIEAMALGVPVVGADHCGIPEVIDHEANGLLFPYGDAAVLAQTLSRLAGGAELRRALALAGRETAAGRFGIGRYVEALTGIIESAAAPGGARVPRG